MATFPDEVRAAGPPKVLTEEQREHYFAHGYVVLPGFVSPEWVERLRSTTDGFVETSKTFTRDTVIPLGRVPTAEQRAAFGEHADLADKYMIAAGHTAQAPMLTRLSAPVDCHDVYWEFARDVAAAVAEDLLGPGVRFHHSKLNFKWPGSMEKIHWHQDIQFWPHTNYTPLTTGVYLSDVTEDMGPMHIVPLSVHDELHPLTDPATGKFTGVLSKETLAGIDTSKAVSTAGPAGTFTVHNARCVHCSLPNETDRPRPLLLNTFASTTAGMVIAGTNGIHRASPRGTPVVRGAEPVWTVYDPRPCPMAPDFSGGYVSPFIKPDAKRDG